MNMNLDRVNFGDESVESIYEIHLTVECDDDNVQRFLFACTKASDFCGTTVKPLVVQLGANSERRRDVMTSSKLTCNPAKLREFCTDLVQFFSSFTFGWNVLRLKIETAPWHDLAPQTNLTFKKGQYFESHIPVLVGTDEDRNVLVEIAPWLDLHVSVNAFKVFKECSTIMTTFRSTSYNADGFKAEVGAKCRVLQDYGFYVKEPVVEFAIYDSNRSHDDQWLYGEQH